MRTARLDAELVRRGLLPSRTEAQRAIEDGRVTVRGLPVSKAATRVADGDPIGLEGDPPRFVSRGGDKLDGALRRLDVRVAGRRWLDVGASTGGFTDRLLQGGAHRVIALDVGYGQLAWKLRNDDRVVVMERVNVRHLDPDDLPWAPDGAVADVSFISLLAVMPAVVRSAAPDADHLYLVKPQFEVGRDAVGRGGVVTDPELWRSAVERVVEGGRRVGLGLAGVAPSELAGPAGNREFFVHLRAGGGKDAGIIVAAIDEVA